MENKETNIPEQAIRALEELRSLERQYTDISYRSGTNGERGLYQKRKSVIRKIFKAKDDFNAKFGPDLTVGKYGTWPYWFIQDNRENSN